MLHHATALFNIFNCILAAPLYNFSGEQCAEEHIHEKFQAVLPKNKGSSVTTSYIWACKLKRQSEFWPHCLEAALGRA